MEGAGPTTKPHAVDVPEWATYAALAALVALTLLLSLWQWLTSLYIALGVCWAVVAAGLVRTGLPARLLALGWRDRMLVVALAALVMRWIPLAQDEVLTNDLRSMVERGDRYLMGDTPYVEGFEVNKPPAYLFLSSGLVAVLGPDQLHFRAAAGAVDALVAVVILIMGSRRGSPALGTLAAVLYAINPISVMSVGVSGHYDPYVVVCALTGLWLVLEDRPYVGSLLLGVGFALKLYPLVIIPWLLLREDRWRTRVGMAVAFALPMALSWLPVLAQNPDSLAFFLNWTEDWGPNKSFSYAISGMLGWDSLSQGTKNLEDLVQWMFLGVLGVMFLHWAWSGRRAPAAHLRWWFRFVLVVYYVFYGMVFVGSAMDPKMDWNVDRHLLAAVVAAAYFPPMGAALWWVLERYLADQDELAGEDPMLFLPALSIALLLFSMFQYNPWYLLWLLPLALLTRSDRARAAWAAVLPWNPEGRSLTVLPR